MRQILTMALTLLMAVTMQAQTYWNGTSSKTFSGSGTEADPYLISTPEQLAGLAERTNVDKEDFAGKYLKLTADIYLTNFADTDTANWKQWEPIAHSLMQWGEETDYGYFRGHFDGNGHTIYNMYYGAGMNWADDWDPQDLDLDLSSYDFSVMNKALFVNLDGGTIENLNIANAKMSGVGQALLVYNAGENSVIRNCHVEGEMRATQSSSNGFAGTNKGLIENCSATVNTNLQGGAAFVGTNDSTGVIRNCTSTGFMRCTMGNGAGFAGTNHGLIENCTAHVDIHALGGPDAATNAVGGHTFRYRSGAGFVFNNRGTVRACAALGNLAAEGTSTNYVWASAIAGFAYDNDNGLIESSYCAGDLRDVSDSTQSGDVATMIGFVYLNGESAGHSGDANYTGTCVNCYSACRYFPQSDQSKWLNAINGFLCSYNNGSGFDCEYAELSQQINCYFNEDGLPTPTGNQLGGGWQGNGVSLDCIKSQAFADTLNMVAQFMGTNLWQYNAGSLPTPTANIAAKSSVPFFAGGDGSKTSPFLIGSKAQLINLSWLVEHGYDFRGKYLKQTADISLNPPFAEWEYEMPTQWKPIGTHERKNSRFSRTYEATFCGNYDGDWHEVQNMYIDNLELYQGLFGRIGDHVTIRNLGVTGAYIRARSFGILAGQLGYGGCRTGDVNVIQCRVSGDAQTQGSNQDHSGAFAAVTTTQQIRYLNCSSSATLTGGNGYWSMGALDGGTQTGFATDTLLNFLMTGSINNTYNPNHSIYKQMYMKTPTNHCHYNENAFFDHDIQILSENPPTDGQSTAWLQSKECVNIYNASVTEWNATHGDDLQINYWEWRENDYPQVSGNADYKPAVVITFNSNGGASVRPKYLLENSKAIAPARPTKDGFLFAGWYTDAALTQFFDWENTTISESLTLYAKWVVDTREVYDFTPFNNTFTSTYHIRTAAQLRAFAALQNGLYDYTGTDCSYYGNVVPTQTRAVTDFTGKTIVLDNDIFLNDTADWQYWGHNGYAVPWKPIGQYTYSVPGGDGQSAVEFKGTFDGQGHVIYGMYIEMQAVPSADNYYGLFGALTEGAMVKNVGIEASVIDGIKHKDLIIDGVRRKDISLAPECAATADLQVAGLLAGTAKNATIEQCYAVGKIIILNNFNSSSCAVGGLVGMFSSWGSTYRGTMTNCYARADIECRKEDDRQSFGLIGAFDRQVDITNCYAASNSYAGLMPYSSEYMGRTYYANNSLTSSYFDSELVDVIQVNSAGSSRSTTEMHAKITYTDWDFTNIWGRNDTINGGYPYLRQFKPGIPDDEDPVIVTGIEFDEYNLYGTTPIVIVKGETLQLHARALPYEAAEQGIEWLCTDYNGTAINYATIDENGLFTALYGSDYGRVAYVTARTVQGGYSQRIAIKILVNYTFSVSATKTLLGVGDTTQLTAQITPTPIGYTPVLAWESSNEDVLTISQDGIAQGLGSGTATVTCRTTLAGQENTATRNITVQTVEAQSITINEYTGSNIEIREGETFQLTATVLPENTTDKTVTWESSNTNYATVDQNGLVTAVKGSSYGNSVTIYARSSKQYVEAYAYFKIKDIPVEDVILNTHELVVYIGESLQLEATVLPENASSKSIYWSTTNYSAVEVVAGTGVITAKASGTADIVARAGNSSNGYYYDTCHVTVKPHELILSEHELTLYVGETYQLEATTIPESNLSVTWITKSSTIASVSNGLVTAKKAGNTQIIARVGGNSSSYRYDTCMVTVVKDEPQPVYYTIRFLNYDGTELQSTQVKKGERPAYNGATPTKPEDEDYTYSFSGWSPTIVAATADADYTAQFTATAKPKYYTIRFLNYDGTELQSSQVLEGDMPIYNGATPTKPEDEDYTYSFSGWSPTIVAATADADYTAQFTATAKPKVTYYTVTFMDWDGSELLVETVEEGHDAQGPETNPTREGYIFTGWSKPITNITANLIVIAQYELEPQPVYYTIRFLNYDGTELQSSQVLEGAMPAYNGATPARPEDANYTYTFSGWSPTIVAAVADADYTAQFTATEKPQPEDYTPTGLIATQEGYIVWLDWTAVEGVSLYEWEFLNLGNSVGGNITSELYGGLNFEGTPAGEYPLVCRVRSLDASQAPISEWASVDFTLVIEDGQGIEDVDADTPTKARKILRDGQIFILRGEKVYNAQGALVK